jgi:hypothetical protein
MTEGKAGDTAQWMCPRGGTSTYTIRLSEGQASTASARHLVTTRKLSPANGLGRGDLRLRTSPGTSGWDLPRGTGPRATPYEESSTRGHFLSGRSGVVRYRDLPGHVAGLVGRRWRGGESVGRAPAKAGRSKRGSAPIEPTLDYDGWPVCSSSRRCRPGNRSPLEAGSRLQTGFVG